MSNDNKANFTVGSIGWMNWRSDQLKKGQITNEEYILEDMLGYKVEKYAGKIPREVFDKKVTQEDKDNEIAGSHHQIYIEPGMDLCYKAGQVDKPGSKLKNIDDHNRLPGYLDEGVFLEKLSSFDLYGIPKFYGFVKLPDGRMSVAEQYISNSADLPNRYDNKMKKWSSEKIYSLFRTFEKIAETVDKIYQLGGSISRSEISGNTKIKTEGDLVTEMWLVDFEEYGYITKNIPDENASLGDLDYPALANTIYTLLCEAIATRPGENDVYNHPAVRYTNFVLDLFDKENIDNWTKPNSNVELIQQVNQILKDHPLEETVKANVDNISQTDVKVYIPSSSDDIA